MADPLSVAIDPLIKCRFHFARIKCLSRSALRLSDKVIILTSANRSNAVRSILNQHTSKIESGCGKDCRAARIPTRLNHPVDKLARLSRLFGITGRRFDRPLHWLAKQFLVFGSLIDGEFA